MPGFVRNSVLAVLLVLSAGVFGQEPANAPTQMRPVASKDESAIRANVDAFVKAYNAGNAKTLAKMFAPEAQMVDEEGNTSQGRDAIEKTFAAVFTAAPQGKIEVDVESIRFIGSALAIESGTTKVTHKPGETPEFSRYTVVHLKPMQGPWLMGFVRDTPGTELTNYAHLKPLDWMIGDWIDESRESVVMSSCKWSDNKNYILQDIKIRMKGRDAMDVSQRIGWDPLTKRIKSWVFDSDGGYGESTWVPDGDHWLVKAASVRRDGTTASATNLFTPTGKDSYTWRSTDRVLGSEVLPALEVKIVRRPPEPVSSK